MNKFLKITLIIIEVLLSIVFLDTMQALLFNNSPLLKIRYYNNGGSINYIDKGLLVDYYYCTDKEEKTVFKGNKFNCKINNSLVIEKITDTTKDNNDFACDTKLEEIYKDDNNAYYLECLKSKYIIVNYTNGFKENIKDALYNKRISINDLDRFNIKYISDNNISCLKNILGGYIVTEVSDIKEIKLDSLIDIDMNKVNYAYVGKSDIGIYVLVRTNNNDIISKIDSYFNNNYSGYKEYENDGYNIYVYNKINDMDLNSDLEVCFK